MTECKTTKGTSAELLVISRLMRLDVQVFEPTNRISTCDLLIKHNNKYYEAQVKTGIVENEKLIIDIRRTRSAGRSRNYDTNSFGILVPVDIELEKIAYVPWTKVVTQITLLRNPPADLNGYSPHNQPKLFDDYLSVFDAIDELEAHRSEEAI